MTYRVRLTARAERDVDRILAWLAGRSPQGAATWYRRWQDVIDHLGLHAVSCPTAPENDDHEDEIRHVIFKTRRGRKYRVLFVVRDDLALIVHVRGPGQDLIATDEMGLS